jgi:heme/copper-type cytochrome/quinol oxidase subunit 3
MSELTVPRTTEARNAHDVARAAAMRIGLPPGWWGMLMLIASEATLMGSFVATYWYLRLRAPHWPPAGIPEPKVVVPMVMTGVLLLSCWPTLLASRAARAGRLASARLFLLFAFVVQSPMNRDAYSSIYYLLLGADHAHVFVGLLFDIWLLLKLARGLTMYRLNAAVAIAWYWCFAGLMTLVVVGSLTSVNVV